jgi:hypothetical protein
MIGSYAGALEPGDDGLSVRDGKKVPDGDSGDRVRLQSKPSGEQTRRRL